MNYDLAKKLKDSGFPQDIRKGEMLGRMKIPDMNAYAPTLEELTEACGDITFIKKDNRYIALDKTPFSTIHDVEFIAIFNNYSTSTPLEAVANLWLVLNTK